MEGGGASYKFSDKFYEKNIPIANMKEIPVLILEFCVTCGKTIYKQVPSEELHFILHDIFYSYNYFSTRKEIIKESLHMASD